MKLDALDSVLVIKPSSLGDVVHTLPAVRQLKRAKPSLAIRWIVNSEWAPLLSGNPDLEQVIEFPRSRFRSLASLPAFVRWLGTLREIRPSVALDFQGLFRSSLIARASGARAIHCLSDAELLNRLLASRVVPMSRDEHAIDRYLRLVCDLGVPAGGTLEFPLPPGERPEGFEGGEPYLLIHPFSRGEGKSLTEANVRELIDRLPNARIVIAGRAQVNLNLPARCSNLLNQTTLAGLIWLIRHARFVLSVDSGPMHIAAAITPELLSIHTWSDPRLVGPYNPEAWIWKGGSIFQKKDLTEERARLEQPFTLKDVATVADFLGSRIGGPQVE